MHFYQIYQYTKFPKRNPKKDKFIKTFEFLKDALDFSMKYNIQKGVGGKYIIDNDNGYYVEGVLNPSF